MAIASQPDRTTFVTTLGDELRDLDDPDVVVRRACELIGEHLHASVEFAVVKGDRRSLEAPVRDTATAALPVMVRGALAAVLSATQREPCAWGSAERDALHDAATCTWDAFARARAAAAARTVRSERDELLGVLVTELDGALATACTSLEILRRSPDDDRVRREVHVILQRQLAQLTGVTEDVADLRHGGAAVTARSRARDGSVARVLAQRLAASDRGDGHARAPSPGAPDEPVARTRLGDVVIVDDNRDNARALAALVRTFGGAPHIAHDGPSGVELVIGVRPRVALIDLWMPAMDGYAVCRSIREKLGDSVRLVAVTGLDEPEDKQRALDVGFAAHITKPPDVRALRRILFGDD